MRFLDEKDSQWLALKDICDILEVSNVTDVASRLDDDEKMSISIESKGSPKRRRLFVSESGVYTIIFTSTAILHSPNEVDYPSVQANFINTTETE